MIDQCIVKQNGNPRYEYLVLCKKKMAYFVREHTACAYKYSEGDIVKMLDFLIDIFVEFGGRVFQQSVGIPIVTNCAPPTSRLVFVFVWSRIHSGTPAK